MFHNMQLRNSSINLHFPEPNLEIAKCSLHCRGSVLLNNIPVETRVQGSLNTFKFYLFNNRNIFSIF